MLYAPVAVDEPCPFEGGPDDDRGIGALLDQKAYRVTFENADEPCCEPVDVIIADCRTATPALGQVIGALETLRLRHPESIFLILIEPELIWDARLELKRFGTLCPIGERADLVIPRLDRLLENLALADECGERLKTLSSLNRSTVQGNILHMSKKAMRVLVSGAPSPVTLRAMKSLAGEAFRVTAAISVPQTIRYLELNIFDCLVIMPGDKTATYTGLIKMLRRNDRTRNLPILVIPDRADETTPLVSTRFMAQGADTILHAPDTEKALTAEVTAFSRRSRLTSSMKSFLRKAASCDGSGKDVVADLPFFEHHLERLCARAADTGKPLCLSAFKLNYRSGSKVSHTAFTQALKYAQMIIRDTDLMTAVRDDIFLVAQPGLTHGEASRRQQNIAEVLQEIVLDDHPSAKADHVMVETSTVRLDTGETAEQLIARCFREFRPITVKTPVAAPRPQLKVVR